MIRIKLYCKATKKLDSFLSHNRLLCSRDFVNLYSQHFHHSRNLRRDLFTRMCKFFTYAYPIANHKKPCLPNQIVIWFISRLHEWQALKDLKRQVLLINYITECVTNSHKLYLSACTHTHTQITLAAHFILYHRCCANKKVVVI